MMMMIVLFAGWCIISHGPKLIFENKDELNKPVESYILFGPFGPHVIDFCLAMIVLRISCLTARSLSGAARPRAVQSALTRLTDYMIIQEEKSIVLSVFTTQHVVGISPNWHWEVFSDTGRLDTSLLTTLRMSEFLYKHCQCQTRWNTARCE